MPRGRAFHDAHNDKTPEALLYGYNMSEQWERALELDPKMVFFTGWNEWTAGKIRGDDPRPVLMVDQADWEYSRDVEPMRGGHFDNYYMLLCHYIRRYKGAPALPQPRSPHSIDLQSDFTQWEEIPSYWAMPLVPYHERQKGKGECFTRITLAVMNSTV